MIIRRSGSPFEKFSLLPYLGGRNSSFEGIYLSLQFNLVLSNNSSQSSGILFPGCCSFLFLTETLSALFLRVTLVISVLCSVDVGNRTHPT